MFRRRNREDRCRPQHRLSACLLVIVIGVAFASMDASAQPQRIEEAASACTNNPFLTPDPVMAVQVPAQNCTGANGGLYINSLGESHRRAMANFANSFLDAGNAVGPFFATAVQVLNQGNQTNHDGLTASFNPTFDMPDHEDTDYTVTMTFSYDVGQRRMLGSKDARPRRSKFWQIGGFVGFQTLETELGNSIFTSGLGLGSAGSARNNSILVGGYSMMAWKQFYTFSTISGTFGHTDAFNAAQAATASYDTSGYVSSTALGYIMSLGKRLGAKDGRAARNLKLDARAEIYQSNHTGDAHVNSAGFRVGESRVKSISGALSLTLFTQFQKGDAVVKPYIKGGVLHRLDHDNTVIVPTQTIQAATFNRTEISFDEEDTFATAEAGLSIAKKKASFNGSVYYQGSGDADIFGGRLGLNFKLGPN